MFSGGHLHIVRVVLLPRVGGSVRAGGDVVCRKGGDGFVFTTGERNVEVSDVAETVEDIRQTAKGLKDSLREMFRRKPSEEE